MLFQNIKKDKLDISGMHDGANPSVFKNATKLRSTMTAEEIIIWEYLKLKPHGFKYRRQHPIAGFVLDFYCHKLRLSIEIEGGYHLSKEQIIKDKERTNYLNNFGIIEIRFSNNEVLNKYKNVIDTINSKLISGDL